MRALLLVAGLGLAAAPAAARSPVEGNWSNPANSVTVRIAPCGGALCGRVVSASAGAKADAAAAGTERLVGTELMSGLEQTGDRSWHGEVFVPDRNIRSEADFTLTGPNRLLVRGCALGGFLCKEQNWTRAAAAPVRTTRRR
ncbi:DUF2147 domain-containing protein [Sphingomonas ginkgonis]|uniref:DUF2147 domain-containing protein n=1 Tax=Sphingomonas ginkgonis TaxID=2315330 RepID=A0A429V6P5_9SPHN|nr:DUF2147 domain-containing protein [Sphingomonas ginkgonis]RST29587.1 DUF2147 domain-containing protein [Sphingomonas ginkgonis]